MARNYIVLDTETAPTQQHADNKAHPETSLVYDLGWIVVSGDTSAILERRSFIIQETFFNDRLMNSAYYANKLPQYYIGIMKEWYVISFLKAWQQFKQDLKDYDITTVWAYNAQFDEIVLNNTIRTYSNDFVRWFIPFNVKMRDIWDYASNITGTMKYVNWCISNDLVSAKGNPSTSAENVYRYLTDDIDFIESHTALDDALIENAILQAAKKRHKKTRHSKGQGWRDAAAIVKTLN